MSADNLISQDLLLFEDLLWLRKMAVYSYFQITDPCFQLPCLSMVCHRFLNNKSDDIISVCPDVNRLVIIKMMHQVYISQWDGSLDKHTQYVHYAHTDAHEGNSY